MKEHFLSKYLSAQKLHLFCFLLFSILGGLLLARNYAAGYICSKSGSYILIFSAYLGCMFLFYRHIKSSNPKSAPYSRHRNILYFSVLPFVGFSIEEILWNESFFDMSAKSLLSNYIIEYLFLLSLFLLIQRYYPSFALFLTLNWGYGMVNHYVLKFKGCPPLFSDILASRTAVTVMGNYKYVLDDSVVTGTLLFLFTLNILLYFPLTARKAFNSPQQNKDTSQHWKIMLLRFLSVLCALFWIPVMILLDISNISGFTISGWSPAYSFMSNGAPITLLISIQNIRPTKPTHYNRESAIAALASSETEKMTVADFSNASSAPSVIVIMNESFADLSVLGDFISDDYLSSFYDIDDYILRGMAYPSVCGGGTCNSEFEFLTGNSMANVKPGIYPYQSYNLSNASNLVQVFNDLGYQTVAFHPYQAENWNRIQVYEDFGFQEFLSEKDMDHTEILSWTISDYSDFEKIKEIYENQTAPLFLFNVTMQNHGGYNVPIRSDIDLVSIEKQYSSYSDVINYLTLIRESSNAFNELLNYFAKAADPVIICMFGDHQPVLDEDFLSSIANTSSEDEHSVLSAEQRYITPYIIWSNYDLPSYNEECAQKNMSLNYLSANLLKLLGISTPYSQYLLSLQEQIPIVNSVGYQDDLGRWFSLDIPNNALIEYQSVQYYELFKK